MADKFYPINSPLINYYFYPAGLLSSQIGPNIPLAGGMIFFFEDEDHSVELPTYSDVFDVPVLNTNPIVLGAAGECPPFYLENRFYYIVITDSSGDLQNPIATISHYNPANDSGSTQINTNYNFIANGQFTYQIEFWKTEDANLVPQDRDSTFVAWAWEFRQDPNTESQNYITFNSVSSEGIQGNPEFEVVLESVSGGAESVKEFAAKIGAVNFMQGETLTFSMVAQNKNSGDLAFVLKYNQYFGDGSGTPSVLTTITTFEVDSERDQKTISFTVPETVGTDITNGNYSEIILQIGLGQSCTGSFTNALLLPGNLEDPPYIEEARDDTKAQILGNATRIETAGLPENFEIYTYHNGKITPRPRTGEITLYTTGTNPIETVECDSASYKVSDYFPRCNVPCSRLYAEIGNTYGGAGDLIVTVPANSSTATFQSDVGGRAKTAYSSSGPGGAGVALTITNTVEGATMGFSATRSSSNTVDVEWLSNLALNQTSSIGGVAIGNYVYSNGLMTWYGTNNGAVDGSLITVTTVDPGSGSNKAQATINFNSEEVRKYNSYYGRLNSVSNPHPGPAGFLDMADLDNNTRGTWTGPLAPNAALVNVITFNSVPKQLSASSNLITVHFDSRKSLYSNLGVFCATVSPPFKWTVTVNSTPPQSSKFIYSSITTDYYGWFNIDGAGSDPGGTGTPVEIPITSAYTTDQIAAAIALATNSLEFSVPGSGDLPDLQMDSKVANYIFV